MPGYLEVGNVRTDLLQENCGHRSALLRCRNSFFAWCYRHFNIWRAVWGHKR